MNGFQIGNKRLKVQHKRVHGNSAGSNRGNGQGPAMAPHEHQKASQHPAIPIEASEVGLDVTAEPDPSPPSIGDISSTPVMIP